MNKFTLVTTRLVTIAMMVFVLFSLSAFTEPSAHAAGAHTQPAVQGGTPKSSYLKGKPPVVPNDEIDSCIYVSIVLENKGVVRLPKGYGQEYGVQLFIGNGCDHDIPGQNGGTWNLVGKGTCSSGTFLIANYNDSLPFLPAHSAPVKILDNTHLSSCYVYQNGYIIQQYVPLKIEWFATADYTYKVGHITIDLRGKAYNRL